MIILILLLLLISLAWASRAHVIPYDDCGWPLERKDDPFVN